MKKLLALSVLLFGFAGSAYAAGSLSDIDGHLYEEAIQYLYDNGIVSGYPDMNFLPDNRINRAEFTKIVIEANYDESLFEPYADESCFSDVPANQWFTKYICFAQDRGIVSGYGDGYFVPQNTINLLEALKIVYEGYRIVIPDNEAPIELKYYTPAQQAGYIPDELLSKYAKLLTRGHISEIVYRILIDEDKVIIPDVRLGLSPVKQKWQASCGLAALSSALSLKMNIPEDVIFEQMQNMDLYPNNPVQTVDDRLVWDNPEEVFVGDVNGVVSIYSNRLTGFGFMEQPLSNLVKVWAPSSAIFKNSNLQYFANQLKMGNPVIVFASVNARNGAIIIEEPGPFTTSWYLENGTQVSFSMYKHNLVLNGYRGMPENPEVFYVLDPFYGNEIELTPSQLKGILNPYNFSGIVVKF
ncbi:S-layer homology domain-containing protein [Candidatus Peregrinibacteria bacterium]|nr:S-layer homology domain-containing protein [Candidatus Peregrinibacteria bacterium]